MSGWLSAGTEMWGDRPVARTVEAASPRCRLALSGVIVRTAVHPRPSPSLDAELDDGTGCVVLRWLGRPAVPGIVPGACLRAEGTVLTSHGRLVVLHPLYELLDHVPPADGR